MIRHSSGQRYDVIVVGAGNAALTAAISASQHGARVLVLEKAPEAERGGNSRFSGGLFRFAYEGIEDLKPLRQGLPPREWERVEVGHYAPDRFFDDLMRVTQGQANRELSQILTQQSYPTMLWMTALGVVWEWTELWSVRGDNQLRFNPGSILEARNKGVGLMAYLFAAAQRAGVDIAYQDRVTGVRVRRPQGTEEAQAGAVILASGGFEANAEMRARYLGPGWDQVKVR